MTKKATIPAEAKRIALRPLALGEKTGHHHSLAVADGVGQEIDELARLYELPSIDGAPRTFLEVIGEGVVLTHQEHKTHAVPPGAYEVVIQREVIDWGTRQIED